MTYKKWAKKNGFNYEESYWDGKLEEIKMELKKPNNDEYFNLEIRVSFHEDGDDSISFTDYGYDSAPVRKSLLRQLINLTLR